MGGAKKIFSGKNVVRGLTAGLTGGLSEFARGREAFGGINNPLGARTLLTGDPSAPDLSSGPNGQDPATLLSQTGGAPLLANIAMGVDPEDALAGFFGKSKNDGSWNEFLGTVNQKDLDAIRAVSGQLKTIQSDRTLRQKAVDQVIQDFPNVAKFAADERAKSGQEFDETTKGFMQQALNSTASKFAAGGNLSSGAANEAFARVGAEQGMNKLNFMGEREKFAYGTKLNETNARLAEVNALRDFQNTLLGGGIQQGFSAQQANLQRQFQGQQYNAELANQRYMQDQQSSNALFGSLGTLAGTALGPIGAAFGGQMASNLFGSPKVKTPSPFGSGMGGSFGPGFDTSSYAPSSMRGY